MLALKYIMKWDNKKDKQITLKLNFWTLIHLKKKCVCMFCMKVIWV